MASCSRFRVAAKRTYTLEQKVRVVVEVFRREVSVKDLCRREGIKLGAYYALTMNLVKDA